MKRVVLAFVALFAASTVTLVGAPAAHAAYPDCWAFGPDCQWVVNGTFDSPGTPAPWAYSPGVTFPIDTQCAGTRVAKLVTNTPAKEWISQQMYLDPAYAQPHAQVVFSLALRDDTNSFYDQLKVTVKDLDVPNVFEEYAIHGNGFNGECPTRIVWNLFRNYGGHRVELKFDIASLSTGTFIIENVQFWTLSH